MSQLFRQFTTIIHFWFEEIEPEFWFKKDDDFDDLVRTRFLTFYQAAIQCELFDWRKEPEGRLAEIIILDQFSRNMFRDSPQAFSFDSLAVALTQEAVAKGVDKLLLTNKRKFLYMPLMHSESLIVHQQAVALFSQPGLEENYRFELRHLEIIQRFGRYPHRNQILGRESTDEELSFLAQPGSSF